MNARSLMTTGIATLCLAACSTTTTTSGPSSAQSGTAAATPSPTPVLSTLASFATLPKAHDFAALTVAGSGTDLETDSLACPPAPSTQRCYVETTAVTMGSNAAYFQDSLGAQGGGAAQIVYLASDGTRWYWITTVSTQNAFPQVGDQFVPSGSACVKVYEHANTAAQSASCLQPGSQFTIDSGPAFGANHIWWHISQPSSGYVTLDSLVPHFTLGGLSGVS